MRLEGTSLIGAKRGEVTKSATRAVNPSTGEAIEPGYHWATQAEVDRAAQLATEAFPVLGQAPAAQRAALLRGIAEGIEQHAAEIGARATLETALPAGRIAAETGRTCGQLRLFATLIEAGWSLDARIDHADPTRTPVPKPDVRSMLCPLGPVAVFSSSNFPLAFSVAGGDTASALAAGCPVVVKPHQGHLGTSELVALVVRDAVKRSGLPEGVFSMLFGPGRDVGIALVTHPQIKAVGFTGSRAGGRALMDASAARPEPIPVYAEMGSINPVFIFPGALATRAAEIAKGLHASVTLGVGQFCTNPGLIFCQDGPGCDTFMTELTQLMNATAPGVMLTPSIRDEYGSGVARFAKMPGIRARVSPAPPSKTGPSLCGAALFETDGETFLASPALLEEVFGPSTLVVKISSHDDMVACAHRLDGQLTATLQAEADELASASDLISILATKAGRLVVNGFPTGVEVCHAMNHGGPYPATADGRSTSVGTRAITRFMRPVCYQGFPNASLPIALQNGNPAKLARLVDGKWGTD